MRLGIMQPYFFPYLGHFSLIAAVDEWVVFDITQYTPKSWMSRNRVLHPKTGWQYVNVPLANSSISIKTCEARVLDLAATRSALLGKLSHYKGKAPFYRATLGVVERSFERCQGRDDLVSLNVAALQEVCAHLQLPFRHRVCSQLALEFPPDMQAGDWALHISRQLGATAYLNPASGREIFDPARFAAQGIALQFLQPLLYDYATGPYQHEAHLSVLDALMWNAPAQLLQAVRERAVIV